VFGRLFLKKLFAVLALVASFAASFFTSTSVSAQTFPINYTDIWWNAAESGWGLQITQHNNEIFAVWYTYDEQGSQLFIVLSGCNLQAFNGTVCRGNLFRGTGSPFSQPVYNRALNTATNIGEATLTFSGRDNATFAYRIGGTAITKQMTRFVFGERLADYPRDNTDIFYQPGADGWGISSIQNGSTVFKIVYHYDEAGRPFFATASPRFASDGTLNGTMFRSRSNGGSHYLTPTWRSSDITTFAVGDTNFSYAYGALTTRFTINGFAQTRTLERLPFGNALPPASTVAKRCVLPRAAARYGDRAGTLDDERRWMRSYIDETYLWYNEVPNVNIAVYSTPQSLFDVLRTSARTPSGKQKDEFHFYEDTAAYEASAGSSVELGYGAAWGIFNTPTGRRIFVVYVEPNSQATRAGLRRGVEVLTADGAAVNGNNIPVLNEAFFPSRTGIHTFTVQDSGAAGTRTITLNAEPFTATAVQNVKTVDTPTGRVGYLQYNAFNFPSEGQLINAFTQLRAQNVSDLVIDLRYNGGGLLYLSSQLANMIASPSLTSGKAFAKLAFSDKRVADNVDADNSVPFLSTASGFTNTGTSAGAPLPNLGLPRVFVLTGPGTASASEYMINGLEGAGLRVLRIGSTTTGKPFGFLPTDNCGTTYFSVEFKGTNHLGFGNFEDGFVPTCQVGDDIGRELGDPAEARFAAALSFRQSGVCPAPSSAAKATLMESEPGMRETQVRRPAWHDALVLSREHMRALLKMNAK
jgi:carboxyl-terminal processing protease